MVAHNPEANEYLVVWVDRRRWESRSFEIFGSLVSAEPERIGTIFRVGGGGGPDIAPDAIDNDASGEYLVAWRDSAARTMVVRRVGTDGGRIGVARRVSGANALIDDYPVLAADPGTGDTLVVWTDGRRAGALNQFGQRLAAPATKMGTNLRVSGANAVSPVAPAITVNTVDGEFLVVWLDFRANPVTPEAAIFGQRFRRPPG